MVIRLSVNHSTRGSCEKKEKQICVLNIAAIK